MRIVLYGSCSFAAACNAAIDTRQAVYVKRRAKAKTKNNLNKKGERIMNLEEIKKAISECNCLEIAGRVYMRNYDLGDRWQTKEALDYVAQGGENTYSSWNDEQLAMKLFNIINN